MTDHHIQIAAVLKHTADYLAVTITVATFTQWLPPIAAALTIVWTGIRIYDYFENRYLKKKNKKDEGDNCG